MFLRHCGPFLSGNNFNIVQTSSDTMSMLLMDFYKNSGDKMTQYRVVCEFLNNNQQPIQSAVAELVKETNPFNK
jgi:hypothetical protein